MGESTAFVCLTHQQYPRQAAYAEVPEVWRMCVGNIGRSDPSLMVLLPLSEFTAVQSDLILIHFELLTHCPQCCLHGNRRYHFSKVLCLIKKHRTRYTILKKTPKKQNKTKTNKKKTMTRTLENLNPWNQNYVDAVWKCHVVTRLTRSKGWSLDSRKSQSRTQHISFSFTRVKDCQCLIMIQSEAWATRSEDSLEKTVLICLSSYSRRATLFSKGPCIQCIFI